MSRKDMIDRAIDDYGTVLWLDSARADIYNARGELWRKKGDRPKALRDFGAALKLNPDDPAAKSNYKALAQELETPRRAARGQRQTELQLRGLPGARSKRRSVPIPNWPISIARSTR